MQSWFIFTFPSRHLSYLTLYILDKSNEFHHHSTKVKFLTRVLSSSKPTRQIFHDLSLSQQIGKKWHCRKILFLDALYFFPCVVIIQTIFLCAQRPSIDYYVRPTVCPCVAYCYTWLPLESHFSRISN